MKCFLSHSSKDKAHYVSIVAEKLGPNVEYDEKTFEEGLENLESILLALERSEVFVLFISDTSLDSKWVRREIIEAKNRLDAGYLKRFFPIIIDGNLDHTDTRIPDWIRETYNLRPITRPVVAAKRIRERLIEVSWQSHPMLKQRDQIFVGRNSQLAEFEQRFDDFGKPQPVAVFASGLAEIGRKTTLKHALRKANLVKDTYEPIRLDLDRDDSIEGLILKLYDLGISDSTDVTNLLSRSIDDKVSLCAKLLDDISIHNELVLLEDRYCIVRYEGEVAPWFLDVINKLALAKLTICVACSARPKRHLYHRENRFFFLQIPELERVERVGLFKRYGEFLGLKLGPREFENFVPLLKGFPEQVTYAATLISDLGAENAFKLSYEIASFSIYRANIVLTTFDKNQELIEFLRFISSFEFVSVDFIVNISEIIKRPLTQFMDTLLLHNVCESIGSTGNYFRVNEVIRDAITRDRLNISESYSRAMRLFVDHFVASFENDNFDLSEYQIAIREALSKGISVPDRLLIPAHFLQTMKQLYNHRNYREVVGLADRVLQNQSNYDEHTEQDIRYYLCQSLARLSDHRFLHEVQAIQGPEHDFLLGFYYRLRRRFADALARYKKAMEHQRTEQRARREIVFVLNTIEDFDRAISLARENFEQYPRNPFLAQAYFDCLLHQSDRNYAKAEMLKILTALRQMGGARATEMGDNLHARYEFEFADVSRAFELIDDAILRYPEIVYPLLTKLDMAMYAEDKSLLTSTIAELERRNLGASHKITISKAKAILAALGGDSERGIRMLAGELSELSDSAKEKLARKIRKLGEQSR